MKKFLIVLTVVAMSAFLLVGCTPTTNTAPVFTSTPSETATVGIEYSYTPIATDADGDTVTYEVAGPTGMAISDGIITWTPATEVTENVVVTATDGTDPVTQSFTIAVSAAPVVVVAVTDVTLDESTLALTVGDAAVTLVATVAPATATDKSVIWASSDETKAIVAAGVVTPLNAGISAITATTVDGGFVATCVVTVSAATIVIPAPTTEAPIITGITGVAAYDLTTTDIRYINILDAAVIFMDGVGPANAIIKIYVNDVYVATDTTGFSGVFTAIPVIPLGDDGEITIHATATVPGLAESAASTAYTFTQDTASPEIASSSVGIAALKATVTFTEAVQETAAEVIANLTLLDVTVPGSLFVKVSSTLASAKVVELTFTLGAGPPAAGEVYSIAAGVAILDLAGNPVLGTAPLSLGVIQP